MSHEIVVLKCPTCGNTANAPAADIRFGVTFNCAYCSSTSVVIMNRELYAPRPGEHICLICGRVATKGIRYCQCGGALVKRCNSCLEEIWVDHAICDYCGDDPTGPSIDASHEKAVREFLKKKYPYHLEIFKQNGRLHFQTKSKDGHKRLRECLRELGLL